MEGCVHKLTLATVLLLWEDATTSLLGCPEEVRIKQFIN